MMVSSPNNAQNPPASGPGKLEASPPGRRDVLLWGVFVIVGTATQLAFKLASKPLENMEFGLHWLKAASATPAFGLAIILYLMTFVLWIVILQRTALSRAFVLTALIYVTVTLGSALWLGESVNLGQTLGIALIITGTALLGITGNRKAK
jgi:drug/metabolite transporter (DMT)-like permease